MIVYKVISRQTPRGESLEGAMKFNSYSFPVIFCVKKSRGRLSEIFQGHREDYCKEKKGERESSFSSPNDP